MAFNYTWKTQDYFDMEPGIRQGLSLRAANQRDREFDAQREDVRENRKQAAVDRAVADRRFEQAKLDALGEATGRMHGVEGIGDPPPELLQNPSYVRGFMIGARERKLQQQAAELQQQREAAAQERAQIGAASRIAAIQARNQSEAPIDPAVEEDAAFGGAISDLKIAQAKGKASDVHWDKNGLPRREDSLVWDDADDDASYQAQIEKIGEVWEAVKRKRGGGAPPQSGSRTNSLPVLRFPVK
jgi:hypothetical protein